jgi:hypothetical protein
MSKLLCMVPFYRISTWLETSIESLLESPMAELSLNSKLLSISIPQDQGKTSGSERRNSGRNIEVTMYSCLLSEFHLTGTLRKILTGVHFGALHKLWNSLKHRVFTEVPYRGAVLRLWVILISIPILGKAKYNWDVDQYLRGCRLRQAHPLPLIPWARP